MEKIDIEKSKKMLRVLSGKEPAPDTGKLEKKRREVLTQMAVKDIEKDVRELKEMIKNIQADPGLEIERYLFAYRGKFHFIEAGQYRRIEDAEARKQLDEHPETELYYICTNKGMCPLPPLFSGKNAKALMLENDQKVIDRIKVLTGAQLKKSDL